MTNNPIHHNSRTNINNTNDSIDNATLRNNDEYLIERLLIQNILSPNNADAASQVLGIYPSRSAWLAFFDRALLIVGGICLALALVFFIAYNWVGMGKLGKFALVEAALVLSVIGYALLAYLGKFALGQQLLLLIASVITGSLLALFGQVYQTGADTWQLFFNWAMLILPFVLIARMPALWLLWLGLINVSVMQYVKVANVMWMSVFSLDFVYLTSLFSINFIAVNLWFRFMDGGRNFSPRLSADKKSSTSTITSTGTITSKVAYHWSTYVVGLMLTYFATCLGVIKSEYRINNQVAVIGFMLWIAWALFMYWRHRYRRIDLLMLTYLCGSAIFIVVFRIIVSMSFDAANFFVVAVVLIGMSASAVVWLRHIGQQDTVDARSVQEDDNESR